MDKKIYVSSSPHFNFKCNTTMIMGSVLIALLPECIMGIVLFVLTIIDSSGSLYHKNSRKVAIFQATFLLSSRL